MNILAATLVCPACSAKFSLEQATRNAVILEVARLAAGFGPDWPQIEAYLACFRTDQGRGIRPERLKLILEELSEIWRTQSYHFNGELRPIRYEVLRAAIFEVGKLCDEKIGFKNHNYLKKVIYSKTNEFNRHQAAAERKTFESDRSGVSRRRDDTEGAPPPPGITEFVERTTHAVKSI
jgi:hypothetical protein